MKIDDLVTWIHMLHTYRYSLVASKKTMCLLVRADILRNVGKQMQFPYRRSFHSTVIPLDFFSWFKNKKQSEPVAPIKDTKELMKDIESGKKSNIEKKEKLDLKPENFIGEESMKTDLKAREELVDKVAFNRWLNASKASNEKELEAISVDCFNSVFHCSNISSVSEKQYDCPFPDLATKFNFTKSLQAKTGYLIPDSKLTVLSTPLQFNEYLIKEVLSGKLAKFKESEPNAIDLSGKNYSSPNIYITPDVDTKTQKKKFGKIMHEVQSMEAAHTERAIEQAKRSG